MTPLDQDFLRDSFPALGRSQVFLDNAGGSQIARQVVERMSEFLYGSNVQLGATYAASALAGERVAEGRAALALMLNAASPAEVVLGSTSTELFDRLARALVQTWSPGDEIIVTEFDHEANISPWLRLAALGIEVRTWRLRPGEFEPRLEDLEALLSPRTRLLAVTHVSNIFGGINPVREMADLVHAAGARICVDGVAYAPHRAVDVQALDADFYGFSVYKTFGAHFAALYGKMEALLEAGGVNHAFIPNDAVPQKMEPGNAPHEVAYSCAGVVAYLEDLAQAHGVNASGRAAVEAAFALIAEHEEAISARLLSWLASRPDATLYGNPSPDRARRVPTVSFTLEGRRSRDVVEATDQTGLGIRFGDFYSRRLIAALGLPEGDGVIRVSAAHYNTLDEIDALIRHIDSL
ncbi:MAG: cysteine desulfurase-like protein [Pseudomonadota bacterium]